MLSFWYVDFWIYPLKCQTYMVLAIFDAHIKNKVQFSFYIFFHIWGFNGSNEAYRTNFHLCLDRLLWSTFQWISWYFFYIENMIWSILWFLLVLYYFQRSWRLKTSFSLKVLRSEEPSKVFQNFFSWPLATTLNCWFGMDCTLIWPIRNIMHELINFSSSTCQQCMYYLLLKLSWTIILIENRYV